MPQRPNYGIDRPDIVLSLVVAGVAALGFGLFPSSPAPALGISTGLSFFAVAAFFLLLSILKLGWARQLLDSFPWRGDEMVLDVGCGRGLWLITAAKHLTTGKAIGVDIWSKRLQSGNSPDKTLRNAKIERVADRVEVKDADARNLPFKDGTFDVVVSSLVIHHVPKDETNKALLEIVRVLKPGGRVAMLEIFNQVSAYSEVFRKAGMADIKLAWIRSGIFFGIRTLVARKQVGIETRVSV